MRVEVITSSCAALLLGCYSGVHTGPDGASEGPGAASAGADGGDGGDGDDGDGSAQAQCEDGTLQVGATPLRRLTRREYNATVRDLLGDTTAPADAFIPDEQRGGFTSNESAVGALQVDQYRLAAKDLAATAAASFDTTITCDRADDACATDFITDFGARAYRRPLDAEEVGAYLAMYQQTRAESGADTGLELVVQTMLMSPHFLYHVQVGEEGSQRLTGHEVASRLSYFLWGTMPDAALFAAAADGTLDDREGIEVQARRLLAEPRAGEMLDAFTAQWLALGDPAEIVRDPETFPGWDPALFSAMRVETETFVREVVLHGDGRLATLLTAEFSYLDPDLAAHYGVEPGDDELGRTDLPPERAGLLTQGAVLVSHAYPTETSWVHRGKLVRERLLCGTMPPPPADVDFSEGNDPDRLHRPECAGCHTLMDPIGKGFDRYDAVGRFQTDDHDGQPIPAGGEVVGSDIGTFDSIPQLAAALADDDVVRACMAQQLGRFALGRVLDDEDPCSRDAILETFRASDFDLRELMVAIVVSDAFRHKAGE